MLGTSVFCRRFPQISWCHNGNTRGRAGRRMRPVFLQDPRLLLGLVFLGVHLFRESRAVGRCFRRVVIVCRRHRVVELSSCQFRLPCRRGSGPKSFFRLPYWQGWGGIAFFAVAGEGGSAAAGTCQRRGACFGYGQGSGAPQAAGAKDDSNRTIWLRSDDGNQGGRGRLVRHLGVTGYCEFRSLFSS